MKDLQTIRKVLFLSNRNIALIVFDVINDKRVVLFADQVNLNSADLNVKINELLSNAANFLKFNIKEVEVVFDDSNVGLVEAKYVFPDCHTEIQVTKAIYTKSKVDQHFVNDIVFNKIEYDEVEKNAIVDCNLIVSSYQKYKKFVEAVKLCNVKVLNATNIYSLINSKNASSQIIIKLLDDQLIVSEYVLSKLCSVSNLNLDLNQIYQNLADKFNTSVENVNQMLNIANSIEADLENETVVSLSYDLMHKKFKSVVAKEIVEAYQDEINELITQNFDLNDYSEVSVITDQAINRLMNAMVLRTKDVIGLEALDPAKLIAFRKIDSNAKPISQAKFEISVNGKINTVVA